MGENIQRLAQRALISRRVQGAQDTILLDKGFACVLVCAQESGELQAVRVRLRWVVKEAGTQDQRRNGIQAIDASVEQRVGERILQQVNKQVRGRRSRERFRAKQRLIFCREVDGR